MLEMEAIVAKNHIVGSAVNAVNYAGGDAYAVSPENALAQLAVTGCFNSTFYTTAESQAEQVLDLVGKSDPEFVAKLAVYAHTTGYMKDMPAALLANLAVRNPELCVRVFPRVVSNGKMLRNFAQILRSGKFGKRNVSSQRLRKAIAQWFDSRTDDQIFFNSVGSNPTMGDVVKMARVRPTSKERSALYAHLAGKEKGFFDGEDFVTAESLPALVKAYEAFRVSPVGDIPNAPFEMLLGLQLSADDWKAVAAKATWVQTFKSLNTFSRQGVLKDPKMVELIAAKLVNHELIEKAKVFPYQILMAYKAITDSSITYRSKTKGSEEFEAMPAEIVAALEEALELATRNVPTFEGKNVVLCPDVSGSMSSNPVTGHRKGSTTQVMCIDVAGLIASCLLRMNPLSRVLPFEGRVVNVKLDAKNKVMTNTKILASVGGGSTDCAQPLARLNAESAKVDVVIFVSDYESWTGYHGITGATQMQGQWDLLKGRNPNAKLVCLDLAPHNTSQVVSRPDTFGVGGFSDQVFSMINDFVTGSSKNQWVDIINQVEL
jgi:60 kDa SS-A/Ro ribonucleoprotein